MSDHEYYQCPCGRNHPVGVQCAIGRKRVAHSLYRLVRCAFTQSEVGHILSLIQRNEEDRIHTRPEEQYWKRSARIRQKLEAPNAADQRRPENL